MILTIIVSTKQVIAAEDKFNDDFTIGFPLIEIAPNIL